MINDKEKKMIQRYCIYPKIAVVALIFSFVQCALIVPLEMIDDLVFQNKGFQPTGMFTALGFVIIYVVIFCFCALAPKFGMNGKKWKSLIGRLNVKQSETDYSKEVSAALASQAVGRFLKESDNDTAKNIGSAMQVAGAVSTVSTSIDMLSEAGSNAENMAHAYRIPIPDIKKQLIAFAVIPILIVVGTYIPQYIKGKQAMDQRIAASAKQVEIVKKALEPVCVRVHADNPNESRSRSSYTVMGYLRDSGATDCYVHVQVNNSGTIANISYSGLIDMVYNDKILDVFYIWVIKISVINEDDLMYSIYHDKFDRDTQITIINELSKHDELMEFNSIVKWVQCMRYNKFAQQNSFPEKLNITLRGLLLTNVNAVVVANYTYLSCYINVIGTYLLIKLHELSDKTQKQKRIKEIVKKAFTASNMNIDEYINMIEKECRICRCEINYVQKEKMKEYLMKTF